jgi:uncharacterized protein
MPQTTFKIGVISDTHNLVRPEAKRALAGVDRILHAGDICGAEVLEALRAIAPVTAVRGNNDHGPWADAIPVTEAVEIKGIAIYMLHYVGELDLDPQAAGFHVVVSGHSHRPSIEHKDGVLFLNPGSAGPRRFTLPISLGFIEIAQGRVKARLQTLQT